MKTTEIKEADEWFRLHDIRTIIEDDNSIYIVCGYGHEVQISNGEISYRAELYRNLKENNLIKEKYNGK
jgi:hypothetical protein